MLGVFWIGWDSVVRTHNFSDHLVLEGALEALLVVPILGHAFSPMVKSAGGECHGRRYLGTSNDDLTLCGDDELAW
jgi:hypothetical protein